MQTLSVTWWALNHRLSWCQLIVMWVLHCAPRNKVKDVLVSQNKLLKAFCHWWSLTDHVHFIWLEHVLWAILSPFSWLFIQTMCLKLAFHSIHCNSTPGGITLDTFQSKQAKEKYFPWGTSGMWSSQNLKEFLTLYVKQERNRSKSQWIEPVLPVWPKQKKHWHKQSGVGLILRRECYSCI